MAKNTTSATPSPEELLEKIKSELADIETSLNEHSLLSVKSIAKCLEEINTVKAKVRRIQREYYDFKKSYFVYFCSIIFKTLLF